MTYPFEVITLFAPLVQGYLGGSMLGRAAERGLISVGYTDPRDFTSDPHRTVDDAPFGGGAGMVMRPDPLGQAIDAVRARRPGVRVVLMSPSGRVFGQEIAAEYAALTHGICLVCGRYEGVDERVAAHAVDEELSIGDYVLTGGELGAMVVIDATSRMLPGVLGNALGAADESFTGTPLLEHPQYTRPREWRGHTVPDVLLSGDHGAIARWREAQRATRTAERRPDLYARWQALRADDPPEPRRRPRKGSPRPPA